LPKKKLSFRISDKDAKFLSQYGNNTTEQLEKAIEKLRDFEEETQLMKEVSKEELKQKRRLEYLKQQEKIKTDAQIERRKLRQNNSRRAKVDWGENYVDPFRIQSYFEA
jgi:hypothetical protein